MRLVNDRHAEQLDGGRRAWTRQTVKLGARADGSLVAVESAALVSMGQGGWIFPVSEPALTLYEVATRRRWSSRSRRTCGPRTRFAPLV